VHFSSHENRIDDALSPLLHIYIYIGKIRILLSVRQTYPDRSVATRHPMDICPAIVLSNDNHAFSRTCTSARTEDRFRSNESTNLSIYIYIDIDIDRSRQYASRQHVCKNSLTHTRVIALATATSSGSCSRILTWMIMHAALSAKRLRSIRH
jgi:hypothetical protein